MKLFLPPHKPSEQPEDASRQLYIPNGCLYDRLQSAFGNISCLKFSQGEMLLKSFWLFSSPSF